MAAAPAAVVSTVTRSSYRYLSDSPWHAAIAGGETVRRIPYDCTPPGFPIPLTCYNDATTLPDGLGLLDNFEDRDASSQFVQLELGEITTGSNSELSGFGIYPSNHLTSGENPTTLAEELPMNFITTEDGKYPVWLGFAIFNPLPDTNLQILGADGSIDNINLYAIASALPPPASDAFPFVGFIFDRPIKKATIQGFASIDHLQYGYGTQPIPEPSCAALASATSLLLLRRRRRV